MGIGRLLLLSGRALAGTKIFGEKVHCADNRVGDEPAQSTERSELQGVAKVAQQFQVGIDIPAREDLVHRLHPAHRPDAARGAFTAGFRAAELHREACLARHIDGFVEHDDAAMADQAVLGRECFIVERRVEQCGWKIGAQRAADLHRSDGRPDSVPPPMSLTSSPRVTPKPASNRPP
jgi:hypothetical protein